MNVTDVMNQIYGYEIYTAARMMDQEAVAQIETSYQAAWDSGSGFTFATMFRARTDDESEMPICAGQMQNALKDLITNKWLALYDREEILSLCLLLLKCPQRQYTRVQLFSNLDLSVEDILFRWNDLHPDEEPVNLPDPEYI